MAVDEAEHGVVHRKSAAGGALVVAATADANAARLARQQTAVVDEVFLYKDGETSVPRITIHERRVCLLWKAIHQQIVPVFQLVLPILRKLLDANRDDVIRRGRRLLRSVRRIQPLRQLPHVRHHAAQVPRHGQHGHMARLLERPQELRRLARVVQTHAVLLHAKRGVLRRLAARVRPRADVRGQVVVVVVRRRLRERALAAGLEEVVEKLLGRARLELEVVDLFLVAVVVRKLYFEVRVR
mmetsp:Transcript_27579/g.69318  ORF Transcript_27579/g.69318 Transcript_27579/m.69318 type:complete len:241 (-) Transcript_27579:192-914(-)